MAYLFYVGLFLLLIVSNVAESSECNDKCGLNPSYIYHPTDCNQYYVCYQGNETPQQCNEPGKPYFDGSPCTGDGSKCCNGATGAGTTSTEAPPTLTPPIITPSTQNPPTITPSTQNPPTITPSTQNPPTITPSTQNPLTDKTTSTATLECLPAPDCSDLPPATMIPAPYNCHNYYVCLGNGMPSDNSYSCPDQQYFNPIERKCESITSDTYLCRRPCASATTSSPPNSECLPDPSCTDLPPAIMVADPYDCHYYYVCMANGMLTDTSYHCPTGDYFHPVDRACVSMANSPFLCWIPCSLG